MTYTQKDYPQLSDIDGESSLLVSFSNLLEMFGIQIDPATLKSKFHAANIISPLITDSITLLYPNIQRSAFGTGGAPTSDTAIMKFEYVSPTTDQTVSHFCLVNSSVNGTIIESYSGIEKSWNVYGGAGSWVTYKNEAVETSQPVPEPVEVKPELVTVNDTTQPTEPPTASTEALSTETIAQSVTETPELLPTDSDEGVIIPVKVIPHPWQSTFKPYLGILDTTAVQDAVVTDLDGELPDVDLKAGTLVPIAGTFVKDGIMYYRTDKSITEGKWYGIPAGVLVRTDRLKDEEDQDINDIFEQQDTDDFDLSGRDKVIKTAATIEGKTKKFFSFGKKRS